MIRALIFDCFGVLSGNGFKHTYSLAGGDPTADQDFIADTLGMANLGLISSDEMNNLMAKRLEISRETWRVAVSRSEQANGTLLDYIKSLKSTYKVAILSNANVGTLQRKFTSPQLGLFDAVVVSAEVRMVKPNPDIYKYTAEKLGVLPEECVFTDDNETYCEAARRTGMKAIYYRDFRQFKTELSLLLSQQ